MRTVGIGAKTEKSTVVAELEAENRMIKKANKDAQDRIGDLETMLNESREEAAELQAKLNENQQTKSGREKKGV